MDDQLAQVEDINIGLTTAMEAYKVSEFTPFQARQHQQNVNRSGSNTQYSQTLRSASPVFLSTSRFSQTPLELSNVHSYSARAFTGAPESTHSWGSAFMMLPDLSYRIVKVWSSWGLCGGLWQTSRAAKTAAQHSTTRQFILWYSSLLQSQESLHHNMACIM